MSIERSNDQRCKKENVYSMIFLGGSNGGSWGIGGVGWGLHVILGGQREYFFFFAPLENP